MRAIYKIIKIIQMPKKDASRCRTKSFKRYTKHKSIEIDWRWKELTIGWLSTANKFLIYTKDLWITHKVSQQ